MIAGHTFAPPSRSPRPPRTRSSSTRLPGRTRRRSVRLPTSHATTLLREGFDVFDSLRRGWSYHLDRRPLDAFVRRVPRASPREPDRVSGGCAPLRHVAATALG